MLKFLFVALGLAVGMSALAACGSLWPQQNAPPVNITNVTPGDGGSMVLLAVAGMVVVIAVIAAVVGWMLRTAEKQRRMFAEEALVELTGVPVQRLALMSIWQLRETHSGTAHVPGTAMRELR